MGDLGEANCATQRLLIDNSRLMEAHWNNLMDLSECIFRKLIDFDKDGLDADFLCAGPSIRGCREVEDFISALRKQVPKSQGVSLVPEVPIGVAAALGAHFTDYRTRLDRSIAGYGLRPPKDVTVIILTNGLWVDNDDQKVEVENAIIGFVEELKRSRRGHFSNRGFSIQLVQFGDDPRVTEAFKKLDDGIVHGSGEYVAFGE